MSLALGAPSQSRAGSDDPLYFEVSVSSEGSLTADYGDGGCSGGRGFTVTKGKWSFSFDWALQGLVRYVPEVNGDTLPTLSGRELIEQAEMGEQSDYAQRNGPTPPDAPTDFCRVPFELLACHGSTEPHRLQSIVVGHRGGETRGGDWVRGSAAKFETARDSRGRHEIRASVGLKVLPRCSGMEYFGNHGLFPTDGTNGTRTLIPRGAFNPRSDRRFSETYRAQFPAEGVSDFSDPNAPHTSKGKSRVKVAIRLLSERRARRLDDRIRGTRGLSRLGG